jgi:hypothetical protein
MQTMAIDLTSSWNPSSVTVIATNKSTDSSSLFARRPDMWYDPTVDLVYSLGGWFYNLNGQWVNTDITPTLWGFKPQSNGSVDWNSQSIKGGLTSNIAGGLSSTSPTGHFNLGGYDQNLNLALEEMFSYNYGNQSWYNLTLAGQHYMWGEAQYVPIYGVRGIILLFGGFWPSDRTINSPSSVESLDTVLIYDIHTNRFFKQPAYNSPPGRAMFCSVAAGASNNESYEMCVSLPLHTISTTNSHRRRFIYGGSQNWNAPITSDTLDEDFRTVYILTVPAFQWLRAPNQSPIRRLAHTCKIIGKRQMLSIGGTQEYGLGEPDPWTNGLGIFDMTTLNWTNAYDAAAPAYEQPNLVSQFYANNSRYPITWGDPELKSIFATPNGTANVSSGSSGGGNNGVIGGSSGSSNNGVIGGVIGGITAVALIGLLIYWRLRRKEKRRLQSRNLAELASQEGRRVDFFGVNRQEVPGTSIPQAQELST